MAGVIERAEHEVGEARAAEEARAAAEARAREKAAGEIGATEAAKCFARYGHDEIIRGLTKDALDFGRAEDLRDLRQLPDYITRLQNGMKERIQYLNGAELMYGLIEDAGADGRTGNLMDLHGVRCYIIHLYSGRTEFPLNELSE